MSDQAIIFGAGNIGRGFIGELFSASGLNVTFVDVVDGLIDAINQRGAYTIELVDNETHELREIRPVRALHSQRDALEAAQAIASADLAATAVGARVLPHIAPLIADGLRQRRRAGCLKPLNIIVCENLKNAAQQLREMVFGHLDAENRAWAEDHVGFVDTVIGRMVPPPTEEYRRQDPSRILVEPYRELPVDRAGFVGFPPPVDGIQVCDNFPVYTARKLYIHNCGHAVLAYLGYLRGLEFGYQALVDEKIRPILDEALEESVRAIARFYNADENWLRAHVADLMRRFANRALGDTIFRLGRDPMRKLAPNDRLIGPLRLAESSGINPASLCKAVAAGYLFDPAQDPLAQELQQQIRQDGLESVIKRISDIDAQEKYGILILNEYAALKSGGLA